MAPNIAHRKAAVVTESGGKFSKGAEKKTFITEQTLKEHNGVNGSPSWIAIKNKVYDVTGFGREHPGGSIIFMRGWMQRTCSMLSTLHLFTNGCLGFMLENW